MAENFDMSHQESISETEPNLSQLKKEVEITPSTLKEITSKQEFIERVVELNNNAKDSINIERAKEGLVYLNEAEKILEYAASCGKTIDKYIIISILHNIACCHQKVWQLEKCSQYLEALIFNFNSFMKTDQNLSSDDLSTGRGFKEKPKRMEESIIAQNIDRRTILAKYYLQFCAVNSQMDNHSGALVAGRKSIEIVKNIFRELADIAPSLKKMTYEKKSEFQYKIRLIEMGSRLNDSLGVHNYEVVFQAAKHYLRQWKVSKDSKDRTDRNYILEQQFKNYSIGNAMQIVPTTYKQFQQKDTKIYTSKVIFEKILLMALGYFTISTELRLLASKKSAKKEGQKINNAQFKQSQIYHLLSIIIAATCIPFEILYMKHVLSSYNSHYGNDLLIDQQFDKPKDPQKLEEFLFPFHQVSVRKYTVNNSFTASMDPEDTISKFDKDDVENIGSSNEVYSNRRKEFSEKQEEQTIKNGSKKIKASGRKSKSKSKNMKSMTFLGVAEKSQKMSPMPKSPGIHLKSPVLKNNLIKVKTSYKLKVSTEKIVVNNPGNKEEKSKKKKETRAENIEFDYFMGRSKDLKKVKKNDNAVHLASPRCASKSSSKRQSPMPKYFDQLKTPPLITIGSKGLKSPRKNTGTKLVKNNIQQYYL